MEVLISPGVFTKENDQSFLQQGVSAIGAAIIGPTSKGPAFVPTIVESPNDFIRIFGDAYESSYVPFTVKSYLKNAGRATIVRVAGTAGYASDALGISVSGSLQASSSVITLATASAGYLGKINLALSCSVSGFNTITTDFALIVSGSTTASYNVSLNTLSSSYIGTILGSSISGNGTSDSAYVYVASSSPIALSNLLALSEYGSNTVAISRTRDLSNINGNLILSASATLDTTKTSYCVLAPYISTYTDIPNWAVVQNTFVSGTLSFQISSSTATQPTNLAGTLLPTSYSLSLDPANSNYVSNVFGNIPGSKTFYAYTNAVNKQSDLKKYISLASSTSTILCSLKPFDGNGSNIGIIANGGYSEASTPWIKSQTIDGQKVNLFKFWTFNAGASDVKVSISDIKRPDEQAGFISGSTYGTFTLTIRDASDTDTRPNALETFTSVNLDPNSANYIGRIIGDQYKVYGADADGNNKVFVYGEFPNQSKYVRVEISEDLIPYNALPMGIAKYIMPLCHGATASVLPSVKYNLSQVTSLGDFNFRTYLGFDYAYLDNNLILKPIAPLAASQSTDSYEFTLEDCKMSNATQTAEITFDINNDNANAKKARKFTVAFQGGYDGFDPTRPKYMGEDMTAANSMGFDCTTAASSGVTAYKKAIDTLSNPDEFDLNMLVLPGVTNDLGGSIISYANAMCEDRQDIFFLFDCVGLGGKGSARKTPTNAVNAVRGIDSNYAATYYPWMKIFDNVNNKYVWVPPSVLMAGVISFNDRIAAEWWAPAGFNRGGISEALQVATRLSQSERDLLYEGRVNPIASIVGLGIAALGQKTLQVKTSALDRVNVRRLLIAVKKYIASSSRYLLFEQNSVQTRTRFLNIVNPYLQSVQQRQGLYAFAVKMDEQNNDSSIIDRNMMVGEIQLKPTKTAEIISIGFTILPTGATFAQ